MFVKLSIYITNVIMLMTYVIAYWFVRIIRLTESFHFGAFMFIIIKKQKNKFRVKNSWTSEGRIFTKIVNIVKHIDRAADFRFLQSFTRNKYADLPDKIS